MKLSCPSCQAKYSVPAEKVVGKIVKARCRKCGDGLVVLSDGGGDVPADALALSLAHDSGEANDSPREEEQRARARVRRESDLFSGAAMAGATGVGTDNEGASSAQDAKLTGQRNDTSVLFSLGALSREAAELERPSRATGAAEGDHSGLIDIRALSSIHGRKSDGPMPTVDDLVNLGGGGAFGRGPGIFAAPELPEAHADPAIQAREGKRGLLLALVLGTVFFTSAVVITLVVTRPSATPPAEKTRTASLDRDPLPPVTIAPVVEPKAPVGPPLIPTVTPIALVSSPVAVTPRGPTPNAVKPKAEGPTVATATVTPTAPVPAIATAPSLDSAMRPPFNRGEAVAALSGVAYASCKKPDGPQGGGHVYVTFEPNGSVSSAVVDQGAFVGTPAGGCIAAKFRGARVPAFSGSAVRVGKSF